MLHISLSLGVIESTSNKSLGSIESVFRVLDSLAFGDITTVTRAVFGEGNDGRGSTDTFSVLNNLRVSRLHHSDAGVGGSEIDSNDAVK